MDLKIKINNPRIALLIVFVVTQAINCNAQKKENQEAFYARRTKNTEYC